MKHAILSASSAHRWSVCAPSALLSALEPDESNEYSEEGTRAHAYACGEGPADGDAMVRDLKGYMSYTQSFNGCTKGLEERVSFSHLAPSGFGTCDFFALQPFKNQGGNPLRQSWNLVVADLKYGAVHVEAKDNKQLLLYASGLYRKYSLLYDIVGVTMFIFQPKTQNTLSEISNRELKDFENEIRPLAVKAYGSGVYETSGFKLEDFVPGEHCRNCKAMARCPAKAVTTTQALLRNSKNLEDPLPSVENLNSERLLKAYKIADEAIKWLNAVKSKVQQLANRGEKFEGFKLVEAKTNRKWRSEQRAFGALRAMGYEDEDFQNVKIKSFTALDKLLEPSEWAYLQKFLDKPQGLPTLVPESDKRPALEAYQEFKQVKTSKNK
jgi:Protein of unknown function (DUF2800)